MKSRQVLLTAILAALAAGIVIGLGALLTGETRTLPGVPAAAVTATSLDQAHRIAGYSLAVITVGLAIAARSLAGWLTLAVILAEVGLAPFPAAHAILAPVCFALIVLTGVLNSESWQAGLRPVVSPWGPLLPLGFIVPILVLLQIALGAAFRHSAMDNVIWHVLNAFIVLIVLLIPGVFVLRQFPEHPVLRPAALSLVIIAGIQVLLGFAVYLILLMSSENNIGLIVTGTLHVINGAFTFAASLVLAVAMQRNLIKSGV